MPIAADGSPLPYDDAGADMGSAPPAGGAPSLPSLDAGLLAQMAMQVIAEQAQMDAAQVQQLMMAQMEQFAMAQQDAVAQMPAVIQAIVQQLAAPPPETLDQAGGLMADQAQAPMGGEDDMMALMAQGALG